MKVLLITGLLSESSVRQYAQQSSVSTEVHPLDVQVAALLTPKNIARNLEDVDLQDFDVILIPGLIRGDASIITEGTGIPTFKGPRYAADLPPVLDVLNTDKLSPVTPADDLLRKELQERALRELERREENREELLKNPGNTAIKDLAFGKDFPMRVMAEIVDAPLMSNDEIQRLANKYVKLGAKIIDIGMLSGETRPSDARRGVETVKKVVDVPVSIDTLNPKEAEAGVSAGADLILSVDAGNLEEMAPFASEVAAVVIPTNQREGYFPKRVGERVKFLEETIEKAEERGITQILGDLILEPTNVLRSLTAFRKFADRNPHTPLFIGVSNFTESIDADSIGVNASLASLSSEGGGSVLLATEKSPKAKGTVRELVTASNMIFLAENRGSVPKDLGLDLLVLKDKRVREQPYLQDLEADTRVVTARQEGTPEVLDEGGLFKIAVDRINGKIAALHLSNPQQKKPNVIIKGENAEKVYSTIEELNLITRLDHAAYLGRELEKAEIALKTGKEYIQDRPLFKNFRNKLPFHR